MIRFHREEYCQLTNLNIKEDSIVVYSGFPKELPTDDLGRPQFWDKYGNYQIKIVMKNEEYGLIMQAQVPTEDQQKIYRHNRYREEIKKKYSMDDEMALRFRGKKEEKEEHEKYVAECKKVVQNEIKEDLKTIKEVPVVNEESTETDSVERET